MKIQSLRNIKTEALLVYIKTISQEYLGKVESNEYILDIGHEKCNKEISAMIIFLEKNLSKVVLNAYELLAVVQYSSKEKKELSLHNRALIFYYNVIIRELEKKFHCGDKWIPEQIIFALLSEWIFEEEKSIKEYKFLKEIDYFKLLSYFEYARNNEKKEELKQSVKLMYNIASSVINKLKNSKFKINTSRKSKFRNKVKK